MIPKHRRRTCRHRGIFLADTLLGLVLITALATALAVAVTSQRRAAAAADQRRAAVESLESALAALQTGHAPPPEVMTQPLDCPAPAGWHWVSVSAKAGSHTIALTGLARFTGGGK